MHAPRITAHQEGTGRPDQPRPARGRGLARPRQGEGDRPAMTRLRTYSTIDEETGRHVRELHKRHPKLGHHGLLNILHQEGYDVDAEELEEFMRNHKMQPGLVRRTWGWRSEEH